MDRVVVIGSINMDVVASAPRHPAVGETVLGTGLRFVPGGKGANQAVAAARLAAPTVLVGRVGDDEFGDSLLDFVSGEGIDVAHLTRTGEAPTGTALIVVDDRSDNTIVVVPGANSTLTPQDLPTDLIDPGDVVVVQFEIPVAVVRAALSVAKQRGARTIVNAAPVTEVADDLLGPADVIVVNQPELTALTGGAAGAAAATVDFDAVAALAAGLRSRPDQVVIVTLGAAGALAVTEGQVVVVPGRKVPAVDSTGAGDALVGALAAALCAGAGVVDALRFATIAASLAVQRFGAGTGMPSLAEVQAIVARSR